MANTSKNASDVKDEAVEKLSKDVAALKDDISSLIGTLRDLGADGKDAAVAETLKQASALRDQTRVKVDSLQETADQLALQAKETVQEKPATALLIAAAVGMLFGLLTARR